MKVRLAAGFVITLPLRLPLLLVATLAAPLASPGAQQATLPLRWTSAAPGVWKAAAGTPERISLLGAAGGVPRMDGLARMGPADPALDRASIVAERIDGKLVLRFPLGPREQLYGLGLNFRAIEQRGSVKRLHVDHFGGTDDGRTHAPVPFYVSSAGYGVLIDAARYVTVYAGTAVRTDSKHPPVVRDRNTDRAWSSQPTSDAVEVLVPASGATIYLFAGPTPLDAVRRYNLYSGGGVLPPKWGLGFLHRVPTLFTSQQAEAEADAFATRGYPLDVLGLEPGWQSAAYPGTFVWDSTRFRDPGEFIARLASHGVRVNLWMNPYVAPSSPMFRALSPLSGSHTVWTGIVPDIMSPAARRIILEHFDRELVRRGVSGYKIDEVDGYDRWLWPDHARFPSGLSGEQMRQVYGLAFQRATADAFHARDQRTWGLVRASNAGAAPLPYVLYDDYYGHQEFITALASSGFIGVLWTPEVRSSKTSEEWLRRMQSVCFSPLAMLNAWSDGTKPWSFPDVADPVRDVMQLRVRLLPYLYTAFARYHFDGVPPVRAMALERGFRVDQPSTPGTLSSTDNPYAVATRRDVKDQFMLGDALLVAPMFAGDSTRRVILPAGRWYDFYTGVLAGDGEIIVARPGLARIPLYVREGATIPLLAGEHLHVPAAGERADLELRHYGVEPGTTELYDDDGTTFGYERGAFSWTRLVTRREASGAIVGDVPVPPTGKPFSYGTLTWRMMTSRTAALDRRQLEAIERTRVVSQADRFLREQPITVTAARAERSAGGIHDFYSEGDYWWPDPANPTGPYIRRDGETNPANFEAHRDAMRRLSVIVPALVAAFEITGDARYARHAAAHLRAWFVDDATRMNPNLLYAQAIKGVATGRGIGIIDTIHLVEVAQAVLELERLGALAEPASRPVKAWFRQYLEWMTTHPYGLAERGNGNNHSAAWALQVAAFARLTGDTARLAEMRTFFRDTLVPGQMAPDGSFPKELARTKPYGYSLFQLDVMGMLAEALSTPTENLWRFATPDGRGMARAVAFMFPYIENKATWPKPPDVQYFEAWPIRHPALLFAGRALHEPKYIALWERLDPDPAVDEAIRNYPVRQPLLWMR